jgi:hypothetical protein
MRKTGRAYHSTAKKVMSTRICETVPLRKTGRAYHSTARTVMSTRICETVPLLSRTCNVSWIYIYRRSTCFRRFLRPSSGAHNCTYSFRNCQPILLLAEMALVPSLLAAVLVDNTWSCMYSYVLLMMDGGTAWNMYSVCRNKFKKSYILLVVICNYITMPRHMDIKSHKFLRVSL